MAEHLDRRAVLGAAAWAGIGFAAPATATPQEKAGGKAAPLVVCLVHPKLVLQDLVGPMTVFTLAGCRTETVGKTASPCPTDIGIPVTPTRTFEDCPREIDVLLVPGGIEGTVDCMNDPAVMRFLADRGSRARWVTSVCTGGLTIAAAGLLKGYAATSHWAVAGLLPLMGARHVDERVVVDRNRMTCAGVTAGIDLALTLAARVCGEEAARNAQLMMEYAPRPPFSSGTPAEAAPSLVAAARRQRATNDGRAMVAARAAGRRLGVTA